MFFAWIGSLILPKRRTAAKVSWEYIGYIDGERRVEGCIEWATDPDDALHALRQHIVNKWPSVDVESFRVSVVRPTKPKVA